MTGHPVFGRVWARLAGAAVPERRRTELLAGASGRVVEIGCGDGRSFRHYRSPVREVTAIEPEPYLRRLAERAAAGATVPVTVVAATAEDLPIESGAADVVIVSLVLCSVAHQARSLAEISRALRPGGTLRFYEHVRARHRLGVAAQDRLDRSGVWPRLAGGCHLSRDTAAAIVGAGLVIERLERFPSGPGRFGVPIVAGVARRPSD